MRSPAQVILDYAMELQSFDFDPEIGMCEDIIRALEEAGYKIVPDDANKEGDVP